MFLILAFLPLRVVAEATVSTSPSASSQRPPPPTIEGGNPLVALSAALVGAVIYVLQLVQRSTALVTITLPSFIGGMVHASFTVSLGFPHLAALFVATVGAIFIVVRYRYLTRYTQLKESALPPPSPPPLSNQLPLIPDGVLEAPSKRSTNPLHSYLDDFLSAIRIFGYLERPVFHELSRHLQTRRLGAGETMELGGNDFWCVVEGRVQVFVPSASDPSAPHSPDPFGPSNSFNGYTLINEVSRGGTLSSLFSILSLFTEDIKVSWETPTEESSDQDHKDDFLHRRTSRANSDVSQLDGKMMGMSASHSPESEHPGPMLGEVCDPFAPSEPSPLSNVHSNSFSTADGTERQSSMSRSRSPSPTGDDASSATDYSTGTGPPTQETPQAPTTMKPFPPEVLENQWGSGTPDFHQPPVSNGETKGTIARATVDSTLAVIPAEAFRKVTRKFPKATGSIVQVVFERFSRVTFMTAHKFLGLTKEILKSEASLNELVSYPLPRSFYTGGGLQTLRARFLPRSKLRRKGFAAEHTLSPLTTTESSNSSPTRRDYFGEYEQSSPTVRAPSLPSSKTSPMAKFSALPSVRVSDSEDANDELSTSPTTARHPSAMIRRASAMRKQVAAGDLATPTNGGDSDTYYRPLQTPGFPRMDTWRGRLSTASSSERLYPLADSDDEDDNQFELRDNLVGCIAKSIGLLQHAESQPDSSRRSYTASDRRSTPNSPMFLPQTRAPGRSPFGNVLDMINESTPERHNIGGLLRESLRERLAEDDASSMSASMQDSLNGSVLDVNSKILRDLGNHLEILYFKKGSTLVKQGEHSAGLYYVIDGFLDVSIPAHNPDDDSSSDMPDITSGDHRSTRRPFGAAMGQADPQAKAGDDHLYTVKAGGLAGYLAALWSTESFVNITAKTDVFVGFLPQHSLERIVERRPIVQLTLAKRLLSLISPLVLHIDAGLDWIQLGAGEILWEKGEPSSDFYIVINGRLRAVQKKHGSESVDVLREFGQNDSIGELDVITGVRRSDTVQAIRESELVRIPAALFDAISTRHPATTLQFMRLIASKVRKARTEMAMVHHASGLANELRPDRNLKTVCVLGTNRNVPVAQFAAKLKTALDEMGASASYLDQATVMRHLGRHAFSRIGALKIAGWLADQEQHFRIVLYVADTPPASQWTQTCIRQADLVLIVGMGDDPSLGEYERVLLAMKSYARKELILLHGERTVPSGSTRVWLKNRPWLQAHFHVELPGVITTQKTGKIHDPAAVQAFRHLRERVETGIKKYRGLRPLGRPRRPPHMNDFARIARRLCGKQVGLVLGGGGARGISHLGMLQALEEFGIPVDAVAGCSIGSFVGGLYARETDILDTTGRVKQFAGRMGSLLRIISDATYPHVAYTTGHEFNRGIYKAFFNTHIEDFWIPFFCNSTNITHSRMEIHRSGYAWRYVRASMTLAGFLPPLSDNGELLVDGGYMDNTPIGPLRAAGIQDIIVVDVGSIDDTSKRNYGDSVSGWWLFINRFNPFFKTAVPSMTEISSRLTYVSSVKQLEDVKSDPRCLYMTMPVHQYETIGGFKKFSEVRDVGLAASREKLKEWVNDGRLPHLVETKGSTQSRRGQRLRRSSI